MSSQCFYSSHHFFLFISFLWWIHTHHVICSSCGNFSLISVSYSYILLFVPCPYHLPFIMHSAIWFFMPGIFSFINLLPATVIHLVLGNLITFRHTADKWFLLHTTERILMQFIKVFFACCKWHSGHNNSGYTSHFLKSQWTSLLYMWNVDMYK